VEAMTDKSLLKIEKQIDKIKQELLDIGEMRPGSLTKQYRNAKEKKWEFYQISYTHKMKSKTEYVRAPHVDDLKQQINTYKKFKALMEKWIDLSIEHSKIKMELANRNKLQ
jgi:hypothetical protein